MNRVRMCCVILACSLALVWALPGAAQDIRTVARAPQSAAASAATGSISGVPELPDRAVPAGIAVDARGNLYVGVDVLEPGPGAGQIIVLAPDGTLKRIAGGVDHSGAGHTGLVTDSDGNVLIADAGRSAIYHIDARTGVTTTLFSGEPLSHPIGLAHDRVGNLYINRKITGALVDRQPFGGFKLSGIGSKAGGPDYLLQFLQPRTITENTLRRGFAPEGKE